ncbi:hypothetical protein NEDG_00129 [Nematocida displodere]|uniref:Reverse transcriptase RNase H-like domain-containing protein n=1 Tax=Nematocida displodere TaxID=1805483 RepID=A0A177EI49_9MICR|nr:hypothetical protein NEDG_00129 [Nematocida displodere]
MTEEIAPQRKKRTTSKQEPKTLVAKEGPCLRKPEIIICTEEGTLPFAVRTNEEAERTLSGRVDPLSVVELEKKKKHPVPIYILKKKVALPSGVSVTVLDVLDIRNVFLWVEAFREKIIKHQWDQEASTAAFRAAVSPEILAQIVKDAPTLRDAVRRIYDHVYTPEAVVALEERISALESGHFVSLALFKKELHRLIRAWSVKRLFAENDLLKTLQEFFWKGLSASLKSSLGPRIAADMSPDQIIGEVDAFKSELVKKHAVPPGFKGMYVFTQQVREGAGLETALTISSTPTPFPAPSSLSFPPLSPSMHPTLSHLRQLIFKSRNRKKNLIRAIRKRHLINETSTFNEIVPGAIFILEAIIVGHRFGAMLYQGRTPISFFSSEMIGAETEYTPTEKEVLVFDRAQKVFRGHTRKSPVRLRGYHYRSFVFRDKENLTYIDGAYAPK